MASACRIKSYLLWGLRLWTIRSILAALDTPSRTTGIYISGGVMAAPTVGAVMADVLPYLGVKQSFSEDDIAGKQIVMEDLTGMTAKDAQTLLKKEGLEQIRPGLTMSVWHNLGCAYSYLFQMEKAMECFWEAFLTQSDPKELVCYLLAYRSVKKPQEYENRLKELNVSDEVKDTLKKALDEFAQKKEVSIRPGKADEMLEKLTGEYHRSTGS